MEILQELPTLSQIKAASADSPLVVRQFREDSHGVLMAAPIFDVLYFDGEKAHYSDDVFDTAEEAQAYADQMKQGELPAHWEIYTPAVEG